MREIFTLIRFTWRYFLGCTVSGAVLFAVVPILLGLATEMFFDRLAGDDAGPLWYALAAVAAVQVGAILTELVVVRTWSGFSYETQTLLQRNALAGILRGYGTSGLTTTPGDAISRFRDEPPSITMGSMDGVADLVGRGLFALVGGAIMWRIDATLTVAAFAPVVLASIVSDALGTRSARHRAAARRSTGRLTGFLADIVSANLTLRVTGSVGPAVDRLTEIGEARRRRSVRDRVFGEAVNSMNHHLVHVGTGAVLLLGAEEIRSGEFSVGELALFVVFLDQLGYLPAEIGRVLTERKRTRVAIDRLHALTPAEPRAAVVAPAPIHVRGPVPPLAARPPVARFERLEVIGLSHRHRTSGRGVDDVSFTVERGSFTVVTGRVGSGKTTLLHTMLGLLPHDRGRLRWNGIEVDDVADFMIPPRVAFTGQVPHLFSETLVENLTLGRDREQSAVAAAVHAAVLEDDVDRLEAGLDTPIGRRGVKLSGGQVQRAALARMYVTEAELFVVDDVSSALDVATEAELWRRLLGRTEGQTIVASSNSPTALSNADQVIMLEGGRRVG